MVSVKYKCTKCGKESWLFELKQIKQKFFCKCKNNCFKIKISIKI